MLKKNNIFPLVTLGIPSYNSGEFLKYTLASVLNQTMVNFECIVVDDCSTDGSAKYFTEVVGRDPRFRLIKHKMNCGLAASRNTVIRAARGKFTAFLDSDDLIMPNSLETRAATCLWALRKSPRYVGSYSGSITIDEACRVPPKAKQIELPFVDWISSAGACPFNANQPMLQTDILRKAGGFNQYLTQSEDYDLWLRLLRAGYTFAPTKWENITYRKRAGSMIRRAPLTHLQTALSLLNSSQYGLADDQIEWSPYRLPAPLHYYSAQRTKMKRIFEFCGMSLASDEPPESDILKEIILEEIPSFQQIVEPHSDIHELICKGVIRQTGSVTEAMKTKIATLIEKIESGKPREISGKNVEPTTRPYKEEQLNASWSTSIQREFDIAFIPHSAYHVWTISLLIDDLAKKGLKVAIIDISAQWRDGGVRSAAEKYGLPLLGLTEFTLGNFAWRNIIVFNDWDPVTRPILVAAQTCGIKTSAIVEGIQDYDDVDVHWKRYAYKTAETIFLPGNFDKKYFKETQLKTVVVGVPRIYNMRHQPPKPFENKMVPRVLINANFSYGVLEQHRDDWLSAAVEITLSLGMKPVISRHPGDKGSLFPEFVTDKTFYECLEDCEISVQRFASGILEALARNVGVIYFNPHGEKVDKFQSDPMGAYAIADTKQELKNELSRWQDINAMAIANGGTFLDHHSGDVTIDTIGATVAAIVADCGPPAKQSAIDMFKEYLSAIEIETLAMTACVRPDGPLFPDPTVAAKSLKALRKKNLLPHAKLIIEIDPEKLAAQSRLQDLQTANSNVKESTAPAKSIDLETNSHTVLRSTATDLLLEPRKTLAQLMSDGELRQTIEAALSKLPKEDELRRHYEKVLSFTNCRKDVG